MKKKKIMLHVEGIHQMNAIKKTEENNQSCKSLIFIYQTPLFVMLQKFIPPIFFFFFTFASTYPKTGKFTLIRSYSARRKKNYHTFKRVQEKPNMKRQENKKKIKAQLGYYCL